MSTDEETNSSTKAGTWMLLAVMAGLLFIYLAIRPGRATNFGAKHPAVGRQLAELELQPLTEGAEPVTLADLRGKVVLLNFWGTWCGPCQIEFPHMVALDKEMADQSGFRLLLVSCGQGVDDTIDELADETRRFLKAKKAEVPCYADQYAVTRRSLVMATGAHNIAYPTTVALDQNGIIRGMWEGYAPGTELEMKQIAKQLLAP